MRKQYLGNSDLEISVLGMGCWQYGGGNYWGDQSQKDVNEVVHKALDIGINYFDTAEVYNNGESEISLGKALHGKRDKAIIGSKINTANTHSAVLRKHCEASLKRLQTDYIDLYMLHWPINSLSVKHFTDDKSLIENPPSVSEVLGTLQDLQREGKIRYIGVSNHGTSQMQEVKETGAQFVANELPYNLFSRAIENSILPYCVKNNIGIIGYMPLQQGLLTGKYSTLDEVKPFQARSRHFHHSRGEGTRHGEGGAEKEIKLALKEIQGIADEIGIPIIQLSLAWAIANEGITTTIVGSRNIEQLMMNVQGANVLLSSDVICRLNQITNSVLQKLGNNPDYYENRNCSRIC